MDISRSLLPNVDRANSSLFKRYLEEQHKSVMRPNHHQQVPYPINSTIQATRVHQHQQSVHTSTFDNINNTESALVKQRKHSYGWRPSGNMPRQRASHTNRFMKRFQRLHKRRDTMADGQKHDGRTHFEFHDPSKTKGNRPNQETSCTCIVSSDRKDESLSYPHNHHHHRSPYRHNCVKTPPEVPRLSLNEPSHTPSPRRQESNQLRTTLRLSPELHRSPFPTMSSATEKSPLLESVSNLTYPHDPVFRRSPVTAVRPSMNTESEFIPFDSPPVEIPNEYWPMIGHLLQEISMEMDEKLNIRALLEIEELLAQRIYECIVTEDKENDNGNASYSSATIDSSALPTASPHALTNIISNESSDLPSSSISYSPTEEPVRRRETCFQSAKARPQEVFNGQINLNQHSTSFTHVAQKKFPAVLSPFTQSLLEPVNLLRTVSHDNIDGFELLSSSLSCENAENLKTNMSVFQQQHSSKGELTTSTYLTLPFLDHLLPPQTTPIGPVSSAFKPIEPAPTRVKTSFELKRPQPMNSSIGTSWFGQS